jgi:ribosomal-protein-alanine N-acetyltransferase
MAYGRIEISIIEFEKADPEKTNAGWCKKDPRSSIQRTGEQYLDRQAATSIEDAVTFIEKILAIINRNEGCYWAICLKENPRPVGTICYFDFSSDQTAAEIGYELHPFYQHKGIMQEALTTVLHYGFQVLQLKSITAFPSADNVPSIRLLERNGFKREDDGQEREGNLVRFILSEFIERA